MKSWEYDISFHPVEDESSQKEQVIACDTEGHCFFNDTMKPYLDFFKDILNERGSEGWELVQLGYHKGSLVCFWKREKETFV